MLDTYERLHIAELREQVEKLTKERDALADAIDNEMVVTHMGVFNPGDDPKVALNKICGYAQDLGKFFAEDACKEQLAALAEQNEKRIELIRRLYVELFYCDQQMRNTLDEEGEPLWQTGSTVRDVLRDAKELLPRAKADELEQSK